MKADGEIRFFEWMPVNTLIVIDMSTLLSDVSDLLLNILFKNE